MRDKMTLKELRRFASTMGLTITAIRDDVGWGYWIDGTGWDDGTFCTTHDEIENTLNYYKDSTS
tara:strand:+ start:994 stop:1185 length:192 start_codon:yes stop_codon:yes gene_type:complete